jgi:hypothetical protein
MVHIPEESASVLKALAEAEKISEDDVVRRALADYAAKHSVIQMSSEREPESQAFLNAFGLWGDGEDGLAYQQRLRAEWDR